jgi:hypothetical protein
MIRIKLMIFLTLFSLAATAQDRGRISGTIVDKLSQKSLANVSVNVEGTSIGSVSDSNGVYRITAVPLKTYNLNLLCG